MKAVLMTIWDIIKVILCIVGILVGIIGVFYFFNKTSQYINYSVVFMYIFFGVLALLFLLCMYILIAEAYEKNQRKAKRGKEETFQVKVVATSRVEKLIIVEARTKREAQDLAINEAMKEEINFNQGDVVYNYEKVY